MIVLAPPLDAISKVAQPYPAYLLSHAGTGLALFSAAFQGRNDVIHFARQEMTCTCVDRDEARLDELADLYPGDWDFVVADAWAFAREAADDGRMWDVVSADTFTGTATKRSMESLELWCALATDVVTATAVARQRYTVPEGWRSFEFPRTNYVSWLVLRREAA